MNLIYKVDEIKTNCEYDVILEKTEDMKLFSDELIKMFKTENEKDPYGELDDSYREAYANYKNATEGIYNEFYLIKVNNEIAGVTGGAFNNDYYGIHSVAIKEEYRGKGIGKETIKQQLKIAKEKKVKLAVLQTEEGYYPAEFYRKVGFKDLCHCYYYTKNI